MGEALRKTSPAAAWRGPDARRRPPLYTDHLQPRPIARPRRPVHLRWAARQLLAFLYVAFLVALPVAMLWNAAT